MTESLVIGFLRSLRDNRIVGSRRLQAARAIELCQETTSTTEKLDFTPIKGRLHEIARAERHDDAPATTHDRQLVAGEWNAGHLDSTDLKSSGGCGVGCVFWVIAAALKPRTSVGCVGSFDMSMTCGWNVTVNQKSLSSLPSWL